MLSNLKAALAARRKRQADLAFALKILPGVLSEVINERREAPPALRHKIARALRADEDWLFRKEIPIPALRPYRNTPVTQ